ncbi:hypothetical protein FHW67_002658 [Herbaspirillum sp. Sphag1AN]|uniref:hypothetical protein n=1 Tax=unclassified Herbaspirillum TaxID=2624150 RepID=UPI001609E3BA|nr:MULTISPECIES: hypothetical protein [unclassified Herbaspirillum]MBB3213366.1 hypothetical protein [Herbaspirillum sp. Sphag1AN]MBB3246590.1 hypothetical protein [Herbaspirillum sp. Sphag64]
MNSSLRKLLRTSSLSMLVMLAGSLTAGIASAQMPPASIRGALLAVNGDTLLVKPNMGQELSVKLDKDARVIAVVSASIEDIKPGSYIGTAAIPQADGSQKALEVHIFPPAMAGTGDGHRPFDLAPNSTMTNGSVGDVVASSGRTLTLKYNGGEKKILIPENVPIVRFEPAEPALLVVGAKVIVRARKETNGSFTAVSVIVGKNGVTPPM